MTITVCGETTTGKPVPLRVNDDGELQIAGGGGGGGATAANQEAALDRLDQIYDALALVGTEATSAQILSAVGGLGEGASLADLAAALAPLATEATQAQILTALEPLADVASEATAQDILAALGPLATSLDVQGVTAAVAALGDGKTIDDVAAALVPLATEATQADILAALEAHGVDLAAVRSDVALLVPDLDAVRVATEATRDRLPTALVGGRLGVNSASAATELDPAVVRLTEEDGFGRSVFVEPTPVIQASFAYGVTFDLWRSYTTGTATITSTAETTSFATVATGATGSSIAELTSSDSFSYRAGQSERAAFTTLFSAPASGGFQIAGVGACDGFGVGYDGTTFGFLVRRGGVNEVRTLTITTGSSTNQNVTVTLDGVATLVAVTNNGSTTTTAREIAAGNYSAAGLGWDAYQLQSTVIFMSRQPGPRTGAYSLVATTAVGSFAQSLAGVTPADTWYAQAAWSGDRLDGSAGANNASGATLDPTKLSVWEVIMPYLGAGPVTLKWQDPSTGRWTTCHRVAPANTSTSSLVRNPSFRLWMRAAGAANISVSSLSMALFCDGQAQFIGQQINVPTSFKTNVGNASEVPIVSIRTEHLYNGAQNRAPFRFVELTASAGATGQVQLRFYVNATLTGANFNHVNVVGHPLAYDTAATAATGGLPVGAIVTSPNGGSTPIKLTDLNYVLQPGDVVTCTAQQTSGTNGTVAVAFTGKLDTGSGGY